MIMLLAGGARSAVSTRFLVAVALAASLSGFTAGCQDTPFCIANCEDGGPATDASTDARPDQTTTDRTDCSPLSVVRRTR